MADLAVDLLINNAGVYGPRDDTKKVAFDRWGEVFEVNTIAPLRVAQRFLEQVARSERKLIVNISSRMGSIGDNTGGGEYIYRSSKAALNMVVKSLSVDLAGRGVTVVAFHPGWVQTDMGGPSAVITPEESVAGMRAVIEGLTPADTGRFLNYDGSEIPW
ncbi:MAG: SDR family oxidoreductase, partial [Rhodospirillales bacterium]|nr:SDR family oxidoreductase [Rhodospirillales bacterium]